MSTFGLIPERRGRRAWSRVAVAKGAVPNSAGRAVVPRVCDSSHGVDRVHSGVRGNAFFHLRNMAGAGNRAR